MKRKLVLLLLLLQIQCTAWPAAMLSLFGSKDKKETCIVCIFGLINRGSDAAQNQTPTPSTTPSTTQPPTATTPTSPASEILPASDFTINPSSDTIEIGATRFFVAVNSTGGTIESGIAWSSSNPSTGTINASGLATGVGGGNTVISANVNGSVKTATLTVTQDLTKPTLVSASSVTPTKVRLVFSEAMNAQAVIAANYKIVSNVSGNCSASTNFASSTSALTVSSVTQINSSTYDLDLAVGQTTGVLYTLLGNKANLADLAPTPNLLGCPNNADFIGNEVLKVSAIACSSTSDIIVTFSKPLKTGINATGSAECDNTTECNRRYKLTGASDLGNIISARVLNGTVCGGLTPDSAKVCITTSLLQNGAIYSVVAANNVNSDGFDNLVWGAIRNSADTENLQSSPKDRGSFFGCGIPSVNFVDGPIIIDPFTDGSDFGFLTGYAGKVYIGPNKAGNAASRFNADGLNPQSITFSFEKDTTGNAAPPATTAFGRVSRNTAAAPFYSIGGAGCTTNSNALTGCGPDNQDGRGLFISGNMLGTEYMFISGYVSTGSPNNDYLYFSSDLDTNFSFKHIDTSRIFDTCPVASPNVTQNQGTDSIEVFNNRIYWSIPGNGPNRPFIAKLNPTLGSSNIDLDCDTTGTESHFLNSRWIPGFGNQYNVTANPSPQPGPHEPLRASSDMLGGVIQSFNDRLYMMNSGSIRYNGTGAACVQGSTYSAGVCEQVGGFTRSVSNSPKTCTSDSSCSEWVDISPSDTNFKKYFSIGLPTSAVSVAPIAGQKPVPKIETFKTNLYAIRNACSTVLWDFINVSCTFTAQCTNDSYCAVGNERPQIWKCNPALTGSATECDAADWSLVADNGSGFTNFGDANNKQISMLQANGDYLYIGFDNPNGIKVYRTNLANPVSEVDFTQIGGDGFQNPTTNKQIYSTTSVQSGSIYFVYASLGQNATPVRVHRQQNN